jgi:hypothetical protein
VALSLLIEGQRLSELLVSVDVIGRTTQAAALKNSLDGISRRVRGIADRVANGVQGGGEFAAALNGADHADAASEPIDVEAEMSRLADEQLRFDATARLLEKTYASLRASLRDR